MSIYYISHFVILNLFQDLKWILKRVQNDSERQNSYILKRILSGFAIRMSIWQRISLLF